MWQQQRQAEPLSAALLGTAANASTARPASARVAWWSSQASSRGASAAPGAEPWGLEGGADCLHDHRNGRQIGHNNDGKGALLKDRRVVMLGAGGAGRALAVELAWAGVAQLTLVTRRQEQGQQVAATVTRASGVPATHHALPGHGPPAGLSGGGWGGVLAQLAMQIFERWFGVTAEEGVFPRAVAEALGETPAG